jgi:hypothetical protein
VPKALERKRSGRSNLTSESNTVNPKGGGPSLESWKVQVAEVETALTAGDAETVMHSADSPVQVYMRITESHGISVIGQAELLRGQASAALPLLQKKVELRESVRDTNSLELASGPGLKGRQSRQSRDIHDR